MFCLERRADLDHTLLYALPKALTLQYLLQHVPTVRLELQWEISLQDKAGTLVACPGPLSMDVI